MTPKVILICVLSDLLIIAFCFWLVIKFQY
jgi:hypothetical protein